MKRWLHSKLLNLLRSDIEWIVSNELLNLGPHVEIDEYAMRAMADRRIAANNALLTDVISRQSG